jgi:hypothetical protein
MKWIKLVEIDGLNKIKNKFTDLALLSNGILYYYPATGFLYFHTKSGNWYITAIDNLDSLS